MDVQVNLRTPQLISQGYEVNKQKKKTSNSCKGTQTDDHEVTPTLVSDVFIKLNAKFGT